MIERTTSLKMIDTDGFSTNLRAKAIDLPRRRLLMTRFSGSRQEADLTVPANCRGLGRIRHFQRATAPSWPMNSLPIDPASHALGLDSGSTLRAQVFQNAVCNWRCWYCFVDFELLSGDETRSQWVTADELVDLYLSEPDPPRVIDLTGGQPDLTPEWVPWMMAALERRGLRDSVYLWSDDNLSNDYFWQYLDDAARARVVGYSKYGRVCCFKGYNRESFSFNTMAAPELFDRQFVLMRRLADLGLDLYAYVTLTTPRSAQMSSHMRVFVDRLQVSVSAQNRPPMGA
jgi:organic radical activating enzyme